MINFIQFIFFIFFSISIQSQDINNPFLTTENDKRSTILSNEQDISTEIIQIQTETNEYFNENSTLMNDEVNFPRKKNSFENQQKWFNLNENKSKFNLLWKYQTGLTFQICFSMKIISLFLFFLFQNSFNEDQSKSNSYYLIEPNQICLNQMCSAQLKYFGLIQKNQIGCLSFLLEIQGQPVGHLWIQENKDQDNFSQKIFLTNKTLKIEHSIKSNLNMLIIQAKILFRNFSIDRIKLSNLNLFWKGSCPKSRQDSIDLSMETTTTINSDDYSMNWSTDIQMITDENQFDSVENLINKNDFIQLKNYSFLNKTNFDLFLSLITTFCLLFMILPSIYGLWTIRHSNYLLWNIPIHYQIQFVARRSLRSSTRSDQKFLTISQIVQQLIEKDFHENFNENSSDKQLNISILTNSDRSTLNNTYL